jgi:hypothetical protein
MLRALAAPVTRDTLHVRDDRIRDSAATRAPRRSPAAFRIGPLAKYRSSGPMIPA